MNIIYLHGFKSSPLSHKGQQLNDYCSNFKNYTLHLPDLNRPPLEVMAQLSALIESLDDVALIGSSLGGFYATQMVAKYALPAVLINPAMRPWLLFHRLFSQEQFPYPVTADWQLDVAQLQDLEQLAVPKVAHAAKIMLLLQQGDEVLDYREAQGYYSQPQHQSLIIADAQGDHAMQDFAQKIPLLLEFLTYSQK